LISDYADNICRQRKRYE